MDRRLVGLYAASLGAATVAQSSADASNMCSSWEVSKTPVDTVAYYYGRRRYRRRPMRRPGSDASRRTTDVLLAANVAGFIMQWIWPSLTMAGAQLRTRIFLQREYYRLVSPLFLHGSLAHLMMNCYSLNNVGPAVRINFLCTACLPAAV